MDNMPGAFWFLWVIAVLISLSFTGLIIWAIWLAVDKFLLN